MQLTKPTMSLFAEDFELMKAKLSSDEIVAILSALSDLCIFGETEYKPTTKIQTYFWDKVKDKFDYDLRAYRASVENGRKGGAPKGNQNAKKQPENNPANNPKTTQDITQKQPSCHLSLDNYTPDYCQDITTFSDKSSKVVVKSETFDLTAINSVLKKFKLPEIKSLTETRKTKLKARIIDCGGFKEFLVQMEAALANSSFLRGDNAKGWHADFDFFLQASSWQKAIEGSYSDQTQQTTPNAPDFSWI